MLKKYGLHPSMLKERSDFELSDLEEVTEEVKDA
jgi:two-component system response regulator GlrR